ncbi:undecaprenyldiphospho-muramoylpentapeptide beta-N-acetylglucosaminyltransferase [Atopococcus tabaci]|uniref:undecaprenyldiphospho-muramoylpentapeptide beta-N-acetylglucosaminyltransferase n=1 Tax=Atopococcus tabaci TaxID=269774 RepID=UPI0004252E41|nr:undecaprenyldiphospho-muramoylpentapeptide beta-N-acetylglucosaminyltransferase [Atopococcus tabaci]
MKVLLSGGGTGGHIYPALALMREMKKQYPDTEFLYIGTERGLESTIVPDNGVPFKAIEIQGFRRSFSMDNLKTIGKFIKSTSDAKKIIKDFQPDVVLGTGGYVCGPVVYAASRLGIPAVIHEQNSVAGLTNKFLAPFVKKIAICFEEAADQFGRHKEKVVFTGNPRAQEVVHVRKNSALKEYGLNPDIPTVLMFGGSRGAQKINDTFVDSYAELKTKPYQVLFVSGKLHYESLLSRLDGTSENVKVVPYISNMPEVFAGVSLIVSRSGATTLAEMTALGLPSILIPSVNVTDDHQTKNALSLADKGAAKMITEKELTREVFIEELDRLMQNPSERAAMAEKAKRAGVPDAADRLIDLMTDLTE